MSPEEKRFLVAITNGILALGVDAGMGDGFALKIMALAEEAGISKMDLLDGMNPDADKIVHMTPLLLNKDKPEL